MRGARGWVVQALPGSTLRCLPAGCARGRGRGFLHTGAPGARQWQGQLSAPKRNQTRAPEPRLLPRALWRACRCNRHRRRCDRQEEVGPAEGRTREGRHLEGWAARPESGVARTRPASPHQQLRRPELPPLACWPWRVRGSSSPEAPPGCTPQAPPGDPPGVQAVLSAFRAIQGPEGQAAGGGCQQRVRLRGGASRGLGWWAPSPAGVDAYGQNGGQEEDLPKGVPRVQA